MPAHKKKVLKLHAQGLSIGQIAENLKIEAEEVRHIITQQWADDKEGILLLDRIANRHGKPADSANSSESELPHTPRSSGTPWLPFEIW